jgi:hypothetical protein
MTNNLEKINTDNKLDLVDEAINSLSLSDTSSDTSSKKSKLNKFLSSVSTTLNSDTDMEYIWEKSNKSSKSNLKTESSDFIWDKFYKKNKSSRSSKSSRSIPSIISSKNNNILLEKDNLSITIDNNNNVKITFK